MKVMDWVNCDGNLSSDGINDILWIKKLVSKNKLLNLERDLEYI